MGNEKKYKFYMGNKNISFIWVMKIYTFYINNNKKIQFALKFSCRSMTF